jgi:outer membrane receptor protein involved in Fe transport
MLDNSLGEKLRIIWGARYEAYTQVLSSYSRANTFLEKTTPFNDILPSVNITYEVSEKSKARFAASQTVNRPEFREISPFPFIDYENVWVMRGNEDLVRANITNLDLRYEIYPTAGEAITFGAFYKHFKNPIESVLDPGHTLDYLVFGYANAPSAYAAGFEFELRKKMNFLGGAEWLDRLIVGTNLSYIYSRVDVSGIIGTTNTVGTKLIRPLQGQSPYIVNFSLMYNSTKSGWSASALYNRIGHRIAFVGEWQEYCGSSGQ